MNAPQVDIARARTGEDIASVGELFREYAATIGVDLEYQGFSSELAALPGQYAPPSGDLLVARVNGEVAGCVALRALDQSTQEMKRLYVRPCARGTGLGKLLVEAAISIARESGYVELRLDTLASMASAQRLYRALGFVEIPPYGSVFLPGTRFYSLPLGGMNSDRTMQTLYQAAGGDEGLLRLASAWHTRVLEDEVVSHAFSHGFHPQHTERLAAYWAEALGGPTTYSDRYGDETSVVRMHSGNGPHEDMDQRAIACFDQALQDIGLARDELLHRVLHDYFAWTTTTTMARYHHSADDVPDGLHIPKWSWQGLVSEIG